MTRDLTTGSPMRLIAGFTLPTLLGLLFQQLYNLVDTMIVGKLLGSAALAAVGSTGSISFLVIGFSNVDLPAPFSPISASTSPPLAVKLMSSRAFTPGKYLVIFRNSITFPIFCSLLICMLHLT